ncbi:hypothetical protein EDD22DRAFT_852321 [Suillus occidentalis]|nr:hypothetical protein EDD22DRAFT_852321 [Suillus occidentalis]
MQMQQHLKDQLAELQLCLAALPADIPIPKESESKYKFSNFSSDAEWAADIGEAAAVNQELEVSDVILEKWVDNTLEAAQGLILAARKALPVLISDLSSMKQKPTKIPRKQKPKAQKLDTHILSTFNDDRYISADEDEDSRKGGAKMHPLLCKVSKPCHLASDLTGSTLMDDEWEEWR